MGLIGNISLGLSAFWLGAIMILPRLWDAISDPLVGHLSDNTRSRWGRRRPYLLIGGIAVAVSFVLMWWIPDGPAIQAWFSSDAAFQWFQLCYILFWLLIFFTACTIFEIPHGALGMEMSPDYHERTRLFSAKSFCGNLFAMSTPWLFALANLEIFRGVDGNAADGMRYVSLIIASLLIPLSIWWFTIVKEPGFTVAKTQEKMPFWRNMKHVAGNKTFLSLVVIIFTLAMGFNFVSLLGYYISIFYLFDGDVAAASTLLGINGTIWAITGLAAVFPLNWLSVTFGKKRTLIIAISLMCLAQLSKIYCYNPEYPYLVIIPTILLSAGMLFFFTLGASMVGDICDEDDLKTNHRSEGSYYSVYWWFIKVGTAFASLITGMLIMFTQFDETQVVKVDDFQASIIQIHRKTEDWIALENSLSTREEQLKNIKLTYNDARQDAQEFLTYLDRETLKAPLPLAQGAIAAQSKKQILLRQMSDRIKQNIFMLEKLQPQMKTLNAQSSGTMVQAVLTKALPLTLKTSFEKADLTSFDLLSYLEMKSRKTINSTKHYEQLIVKTTKVENALSDLKTQLTHLGEIPASFTTDIETTKKATLQLKLQAPYTLFWMRAVEIGLPLLLSIISIFFAVRYPLTEDRCYEIKIALKTRNKNAKFATC
ncbi:MFS transporter [Paremcibacter congregatus]|nr:MFS transporter [Paremcibacter congregatus]